MKVLYIYRSKNLGLYSIEKHFKLITKEIHEVGYDEIYLPFKRANILGIIGNLLYLKKYISTNKYDLYHVTGHVHYATLVLPAKRTILTVHDLGGLRMFKGVKKYIYKLLWCYLPFQHCAIVAAISNNTLNEIKMINQDFDKKVIIAPPPIEGNINKSLEKRIKNSVLMIGTAKNKNHIRCIKALSNLDCEVTIVGNIPDDERELMDKYKIRYRNFVDISDSKIELLYKTHSCLLFMSTYEGFGVVIIEAQKNGCPVITSNIEPMISVSGNAAALADPYSEKDIKNKLNLVLRDHSYSSHLVELGYENCKKYFSRNVANIYMDIYRKMIRNIN